LWCGHLARSRVTDINDKNLVVWASCPLRLILLLRD